MKTRLFIFIFLTSLSAAAQKVNFSLQNPLNLIRTSELIIIKRSEAEKKYGKKLLNAPFHGRINGEDIAFQFDDINKDGQWDEIAFLLDFKPSETKKMELIAGKSAADPEVKAHVRQRRKNADNTFGPQIVADSVPAGQPNTDFSKTKLPPFLTEGPAWENDKVGFRIYMDIRNTKDIWGKIIPKMMMDTVGANPKEVYHNLSYWGMDILAVGKSLGAGSIALNVPRPGKPDTLVRLGGPNMGKILYEQVADGPYRAIFRMHYPQWNVLGDGKLTDLTEEITIWGGQYFYQSSISVNNMPAGASVVTGIVNLKSKTARTATTKFVKIRSTYDLQSENKDGLGMAVIANVADLRTTGKTSDTNGDVRNTYTATFNSNPVFRFYAGWEKSDPRFASAAGFNTFLMNDAAKMAAPVLLK